MSSSFTNVIQVDVGSVSGTRLNSTITSSLLISTASSAIHAESALQWRKTTENTLKEYMLKKVMEIRMPSPVRIAGKLSTQKQ